MDEIRTGRRERRRRKAGAKAEGNEFEKTMENVELSIGPHVTHSFGRLVRRDTYAVLRSRSDFDVGNVDDDARSPEGSANDSVDSRNLTYSLSNASEKSPNCTYNVERRPESNELRPVPAPRKRKLQGSEAEKVSSDTDRDVTEIDLDEPRRPSSTAPESRASPTPPSAAGGSPSARRGSENRSASAPVPKPRTTAKNLPRKVESSSEKSTVDPPRSPVKSPRVESFQEKSVESEEEPGTVADSPSRPDPKELPLVADLQEEAKSEEPKQKSKRQRKLIGDLLERKGKKKKLRTFSSLMKLEKKKIPKISSILKDLKEEESGKSKADAEEDKEEGRTRRGESAQNGQIYVQCKSGFRAKEREEVLRNGNRNSEKDGNDGMAADSTVQTAILVQKYWSRAMTYFHGVLAGFGFSHAATITAIMVHCNYEPREFAAVYSCLSLKIHYAFYTLTALCIVSCFDRIDVGHVNRKHWRAAWRAPSAWVVLVAYAIGFALTFANQTTEARFDALPGGNETEIWNGQSGSKIQVQLLQWYHGAWARDVLVLFAWLVIALTKFDDLLLSHVGNMAKYAEARGEEKSLRLKSSEYL